MGDVKAVAWLVTWPDSPELGSLLSEEPPSDFYAHGVPLVPESALAALRDEVERLEAIAVLAKRAQWLHSACWDLADGSGCFINTDSMRRFDEVFNDLGVALGDIVIDADEERELFERPGARAARLEAENARLRGEIAALVSQFDHTGCTCTFPSDTCCAYSRAALAEKEGGR